MDGFTLPWSCCESFRSLTKDALLLCNQTLKRGIAGSASTPRGILRSSSGSSSALPRYSVASPLHIQDVTDTVPPTPVLKPVKKRVKISESHSTHTSPLRFGNVELIGVLQRARCRVKVGSPSQARLAEYVCQLNRTSGNRDFGSHVEHASNKFSNPCCPSQYSCLKVVISTRALAEEQTVTYVVFSVPPEVPADPTLRRSQRVRVPLLAWYTGERIKYGRRASGESFSRDELEPCFSPFSTQESGCCVVGIAFVLSLCPNRWEFGDW